MDGVGVSFGIKPHSTFVYEFSVVQSARTGITVTRLAGTDGHYGPIVTIPLVTP
jgi:hypothetical protein